MPTPPSHTGPVTLADWTRTPAVTFLRNPAPNLTGEFVGAGGGWRETIAYRIPVKDYYDFAQFASGNPYTVTVGGGTAVRYIPLSHPDVPAMICTGVNAVPKGGYTTPGGGSPPTGPTPSKSQWSDAAVLLTFTTVPYALDGSTPFMTTETRGGAEVYTLAGSKLHFASDGALIQADAGVTVPTLVYTVTIYLAFSLNDSVLNPLLGNVSNATFLGMPAGTVRFDSYNSSVQMTAGGGTAYTRTLLLTYRPVPWNQFLRPDGTWENALTPAGNTVYTASDLSPLTA